jgi:ATP/ADP translocase
VLFCCFAGAILGDNAAESLLLAHCDTRLIPYMFLVNAVFLFMSSTVLMSLIDKVDRGVLFTAMTFGHGAVLLLIKTALMFKAPVLYPFLFSYAYVSKILLFLIFWTLVSDLVDTRRASAEFPFIAAGGTLGAICVSFAVPWLMKVTSADNLLLVWAFIACVLGALFFAVRASFGASFRASSDKLKHMRRSLKTAAQDLKLVKRDPLLWNMAVFYFLLFFTVLNQHYLFYGQLKSRLTSSGELATFLGYFNGVSMAATFILQLTVAGPMLKKIGSTRSMLFLPAVLCCVFIVLAYLGLFQAHHETTGALFWGVTIGMGLRIAFFDSFFSPNFQIFFSGLPQAARGKGKLSIEGVVKPFAMICASVWLIAVAPRLSLGVSMAILFYCSIGMLIQTFRIRKKYTESLARGLTGYKSKKLSALFNFVDLAKEDNFLTTLSKILEKEEYEIKKYIIEILVEMNSKESLAILLDYAETCDAVARATIISSLGVLKNESLGEVFARFLHDPDKRVAANSICALAALESAGPLGDLEAFLHDPDNRVKANTVVALWQRWTPAGRKRLRSIVLTMLGSGENDDCASALFAMGELKMGEFLPDIKKFMYDHFDALSADEAIWRQTITAVAKIGGEPALSMLLGLCANVNRRKKGDIVKAVGTLLAEGFPLDAFVKLLPKANYLGRSVMLGAIYERRLSVDKSFDGLLRDVALEEVRGVYSEWMSAHTLDSKTELAGVKLLRTALFEECIEERLQNAVYVAALLDKSGQVRAVVPRLHHPDRHVRARALEILDNAGDAKINRSILRLLDTGDAAIHGREAALCHKIRSKSLMEVVADHIDNHHAWLKQCALFAASSLFADTKDPRWGRLMVREP